MPLTVSFTCSQSSSAPDTVVFDDTSSGSDAAVTQRRIYVTDYAGNYIVPSGTSTSYVAWAIGTNPLTVTDLLTSDIAANVLVQWLNSSNAVLYSTDDDFPFVANLQQFDFYLIQQLALRPATLQDTNYMSNLAQLWTYIVSAQNAITYGNSIAASQNLINLAYEMKNNESKYF